MDQKHKKCKVERARELREKRQAGKAKPVIVKKDTIKKNDHPVEKPDLVNHPSHYTRHPVEVIDIIRDALTRVYGPEGYKAYCLGNEIKYRMRAGLKGDPVEDISKAMKYLEFREGA
jgi:hypothetical protein